MITKPGGGQPATLGRSNTGQIIMVTTGSTLRTVQTITNSQAGQGNTTIWFSYCSYKKLSYPLLKLTLTFQCIYKLFQGHKL